MLVQYMLFKVCIQPRPFFTRNVGIFGPTMPSDVNDALAIFPYSGKYSPDLDKWIRNFQASANASRYGPLTVDGRINRAPVGWGKKSMGATGGHWYTIQALNLLMFQMCEGPYSELPRLSDVPAQLAQELQLVVLPEWAGP
jgi:hypothetical protein